MRKDMDKLVAKVVRNTRYIRRPGRTPRTEDDLPMRQSMSAGHGIGVYNTVNNSAPLNRWLHSQVGRKWSQVFAELCRAFDTRSNVGKAVRDYVADTVRTAVFEEDGQLMYRSTWGNCFSVEGELYVDPSSGLLTLGVMAETRRAREARRAAERQAARDAACVQVSRTRQLRLLDGQWFWVELMPVTTPRYTQRPTVVYSDGSEHTPSPQLDYDSVCRDVLSGERFYNLPSRYHAQELMREYGDGSLYAAHKYQASNADIRRHVSR
jgi:hypothetical protein